MTKAAAGYHRYPCRQLGNSECINAVAPTRQHAALAQFASKHKKNGRYTEILSAPWPSNQVEPLAETGKLHYQLGFIVKGSSEEEVEGLLPLANN